MSIGNHEYNIKFLSLKPPSQPSPTGEGAESKAFPPCLAPP